MASLKDSFSRAEVLIPRGTPVPEQLAAHGVDVSHHFAGKGYTKVFNMPAGTTIGQHRHKSNHAGALLLGRANLHYEGRVIELIAPTNVLIIAHKEHAVEALTDVLWACIWPDVKGLTDPEEIDHNLIDHSATAERTV